MKLGVFAIALIIGGCGDDASPEPPPGDGGRLESAAVRAGLVTDPASAPVIGSYASDGDRICVLPGEGGRLRVGVVADYGEGQRCFGRGEATRSGGSLEVALGACRLTARVDGERITFPAALPDECDALCTGRATLAAVDVERLSGSVSEAAAMRDVRGRPVCDN